MDVAVSDQLGTWIHGTDHDQVVLLGIHDLTRPDRLSNDQRQPMSGSGGRRGGWRRSYQAARRGLPGLPLIGRGGALPLTAPRRIREGSQPPLPPLASLLVVGRRRGQQPSIDRHGVPYASLAHAELRHGLGPKQRIRIAEDVGFLVGICQLHHVPWAIVGPDAAASTLLPALDALRDRNVKE